eukprot:jgi/Hompol1/5716/HPOL_002033-RA
MSSRRANALRAGLDPEFHDLLVKLGKTNSLSQQRNLISAEVQSLRLKMAAPFTPLASSLTFVPCRFRAFFCEMMGFDTSDFAHLEAVLLCQNARNLYEKRIAHLIAAIFLGGHSDLGLLMTNTLQRDLSSNNVYEVAMALSVVSSVVTAETLPSLIHELVRRKSVLVFRKLWQIDKQAVHPYIKKIKHMIADPDPSVMSASLITLHELVLNNPTSYKSLASAVVHILNQILEHRLDCSYDYHGVPAPYIQVNCMRLLALFDTLASEIATVVLDAFHRVDTNQQDNIAYMVMLQCVKTLVARQATAAQSLNYVLPVVLRLLNNGTELDRLAAIECVNLIAVQYPSRVISVAPVLTAVFDDTTTDMSLKQTFHNMQHITTLAASHIQDPVISSKLVLESFEMLSDATRPHLTNTIMGHVSGRWIAPDLAISYAIRWLQDPVHPRNKTWLATWCGAANTIDHLATLLSQLAASPADPDLVSHVVEMSIKLGSTHKIVFPNEMIKAVATFGKSPHIGLTNRVRQFFEAANSVGSPV